MPAPMVDDIEATDAPVWYVSYGSNMSWKRFECYLVGGRPVGSTRDHDGARDRTPPRADAGVSLPGRAWFAGDAPGWGGGGVAFYDHEFPGHTSARAYLITAGQFTDVHTQEGPLYSRLVHLGTREGVPMMTFTTPHGIHEATHTRPSEQYLDTLRVGLREAHDWDDSTISHYLTELALPPEVTPRVS